MPAIIYDPFTVDDTSLTSTNLTETATEWSDVTIYAAADEVYVLSTKKIYVSKVDSNLANDPATDDGTNWILKGAMNKWAAFDAYVSNKASQSGSITYTIAVDEITTGISFFGLVADYLTITVSKDTQSITYNADLKSYGYIGGSWFNWFFDGRPSATEYTINNLAYFGAGTVVEIEISVDSGNAQVGQIVLGRGYELGDLLAGVDLRSKSFTKYEEDEFANLTLIKRPKVILYDMNISVDNGNVKKTQELLKRLSDIPTVIVGSEVQELGLIVFGVLISHDNAIPHKDMHQIKTTFRELV